MQISTVESFARPDLESVDLTVSSSGMTVSVGAGAFVLGGVSHDLTEDATATLASDPAHKTFATVYLCKEVGTGLLKVVVDEMVKDPAVTPVPYQFKGSPYNVLHQLAYIEVGAGVSDLDAAPCMVWRVVPKPEE